MMYTPNDSVRLLDTAYRVRKLMESVGALDDFVEPQDTQTTYPIMDQIMVKAYNALHEYVMYREQRMREEENG